MSKEKSVDKETLMEDLNDKRCVGLEMNQDMWHLSRKETAEYLLDKYNITSKSEIEPNNEKPMESKSIGIIKKHLKEQASSIFNDNEPLWDDIVDAVNEALQTSSGIQPDPNHDKPYLFYEGEKYYFGEEYEFSDEEKDHSPDVAILIGFELHSDFKFETDNCNYKHILKIDHTAKYKKLFLELKEQAEKDGVNLKELI